MMCRFGSLVLTALGLFSLGTCRRYENPILPGWHSDPSCAFVPEWNSTFFCTTSSFLAFPGLPVYASKDLTKWKLASHAHHDASQIPNMLVSTSGENEGTFASTLRYRDGTFYLITVYVSFTMFKPGFLLFTTTDPYNTSSWSQPISVPNPGYKIDPDLFWDDDGSLHIASSGTYLQSFDLETGESTAPVSVWNGTGGSSPEGPHLYRKDGWYYLLIAEGGTELGHSATIARSRQLYGPYESYDQNPILTNRNTSEYFQTVGHADLFLGGDGNWWGVALATRSGPAWTTYPMGRETVLYLVAWEQDQWPAPQQVRGNMEGPLPEQDRNILGAGHWVDSGDEFNFAPGSETPSHFVHWRPPPNNGSDYAVSPPGHDNTLRLSASKANLTGSSSYVPTQGQTFISRRQSHTCFLFSVDISAQLEHPGDEAGLTVFLTSLQHIDLSLVNIANSSSGAATYLRLGAETKGKPNATSVESQTYLLPPSWRNSTIRLVVNTTDGGDSYTFFAYPSGSPSDVRNMGTVSAEYVSGGSGPFTGTLLGAFATTNGGNETFQAYFSRWRYTPLFQIIE